MRKLCSLLLLTLSAWLLVAPLAASRQQQNLLPACCRRLGAHHCAQTAAAMQPALDRQHKSFGSTECLLMPHRGAAMLEPLIGAVTLATLPFLASWFPFFAAGALENYARVLALKSPRGPPCLSLA